MKISILANMRRSGKETPSGNGITNGLNKGQKERIKELQETWLTIALQLIARSSERSEASIIGITSAGTNEGKTTNCLGLAAALARETDTSVSLVECDLVSASIASLLGLDPTPGLTEYLESEATIEDIIKRTNIPNLDVIVAGGSPDADETTEVWSHPELSRLRRGLPKVTDVLKQLYGFVVLDLPPLLTNAYGKEMVKYTDETFLSAMSGVTPMESLARASRTIEEGKLSGILLAGASSPLPEWINKMLVEAE